MAATKQGDRLAALQASRLSGALYSSGAWTFHDTSYIQLCMHLIHMQPAGSSRQAHLLRRPLHEQQRVALLPRLQPLRLVDAAGPLVPLVGAVELDFRTAWARHGGSR